MIFILIQKVDIKRMNPATYNPRKDLKENDKEFIEIKNSLENFGLVEPIVWNKRTGNIIGGHQRFKILVASGLKEIECSVVDFSEEKEKACNLALNKTSGIWDDEKLNELLYELESTDFNMSDFGFEKELEEVKSIIENEIDVEDDYSEKDELPRKVNKGDLWKLGNHFLMCGDSTNENDIKFLMQDKKAKILFTSPPYSDMRDYNGNKNLETNHLCKFISAYKNYVDYQIVNLGLQRKDGEIFPYWDEYINHAKENNLKLLSWNVWDKTMCGSIGNQSAFFPIRHEWIFIFGEEKTEIKRTVEKKTETQKKIGKQRKKDGTFLEFEVKANNNKLKKMESVVSVVPATKNKINHPAVFPVELPSEFIKAMTDKNDIVVESFCGSGTTLIACEKLERKCYGMELDEKYCDLIIDRWETLTGQKAEKIKNIILS